jgi:nucleotide-binding universal stress UspA family protein
MDFSAPARRALEVARRWFPTADLTVLHVLDAEFAARVQAHGIVDRSEVLARLRAEAEAAFASLLEEHGAGTFETMIVEGAPFLEIVKLARDLAVDVVVMGMRSAERKLGEFLAGSTAERVLRASHCPVIAVP